MKKIIFIFSILQCIQILSTDTTSLKYFPLAINNRWVYDCFLIQPATYWQESVIITKDTIVNGKRYFYFYGIDFLEGWIRVDSSDGKLFMIPPLMNCPIHPFEQLVDSFPANYHEHFYKCQINWQDLRKCDDTTSFIFGGISYKSKSFSDTLALTATTNRYAKNLGIVTAIRGDPYTTNYTLRGCLINGIVFGDTTFTGINTISAKIPNSFSLSQNYPNPFNPSTKIKFDTPLSPPRRVESSTEEGKYVQLIIYDILGREVATIINETLQPGTYEVEWNASNYPSGVYFYTLISGNYKDTRKMVLLR